MSITTRRIKYADQMEQAAADVATLLAVSVAVVAVEVFVNLALVVSVAVVAVEVLVNLASGSHRTYRYRLRWRSGGRQTDEKETLPGLNERKHCTVSCVSPQQDDTNSLRFDLRHHRCFRQS